MTFDQGQLSYQKLRSIVSERTSKLVIWCGAGLSNPAGVPTWAELRRSLAESLKQKVKSALITDREELERNRVSIELEQNPWVAFERYLKALGATTYTTVIRESLRISTTAPVPSLYSLLWRLRPTGLLNLNLDRLATRAFHDLYSGRSMAEFESQTVGAHTHILKGLTPYIYNMHGTLENRDGWVLTYEELRQLKANGSYLNFVRSILSTSTVIFVGLSADDVSVGGHLEWLRQEKIDCGAHYWLSDRSDSVTDSWAEDAGILVIRYSNANGKHAELHEAINDLLTFVPPEEGTPAPPVIHRQTGSTVRLTPEELMGFDAESVRYELNAYASEVLKDDSETTFTHYEEFIREYDEPIHKAWYTSTSPGKNCLLGYSLEKEVARGAFSRVFKAVSKDGEPVAIKLLHNEIRDQRALLLAFRRGVRSMSILSKYDIQGIVKYRAASEIPSFVVMDWIDGANLKEAVLAHRLSDWGDILQAMSELSSIIYKAHRVTERVLHRDLRPANIMLDGFWDRPSWRTIVLDFDLSWHRGAYDKSVTHGSGTAGYLAPEQILEIPGVSTRHAAVDAFGLGMTLYFTASGKDPVPSQHKHTDWQEMVCRAAEQIPCAKWRSLPARYARVIKGATRDKQSDRLDVGQIVSELHRLRCVLTEPHAPKDADLIAEEIAARSSVMDGYSWDTDRNTAVFNMINGICCALVADESSRQIHFSTSYNPTGLEERAKIGKRLHDSARSFSDLLKRHKWHIVDHSADKSGLVIKATLDVEKAASQLNQIAKSIDDAINCLRLA